MAVVMQMEWPAITPELYDEARRLVRWEEEPPVGGIFHVVGWDNGVFRVTDVWESEEEFNRFCQERLFPNIASLNIPGEPKVTVYSAYRRFAPGYTREAVGV